ncbi:hypothetical protein RchiOBHm_Chr6g0287001 [Rosa chinensis]|uniref:Uncharacterized protein n=1 Tax=Rosa chinensis TaxID=74649 RepID=A0A2P6PUZ8_ROSCH|nr:hypothetical protein RchiOBHm_Chr6g0287001 [Rosa chinensis]
MLSFLSEELLWQPSFLEASPKDWELHRRLPHLHLCPTGYENQERIVVCASVEFLPWRFLQPKMNGLECHQIVETP